MFLISILADLENQKSPFSNPYFCTLKVVLSNAGFECDSKEPIGTNSDFIKKRKKGTQRGVGPVSIISMHRIIYYIFSEFATCHLYSLAVISLRTLKIREGYVPCRQPQEGSSNCQSGKRDVTQSCWCS